MTGSLIPWRLLLPGDRHSPVLWLGGREAVFKALSRDFPIAKSPSSEAYATVIRGPGGADSLKAVSEPLRSRIGPETCVIWIKGLRREKPTQEGPVVSTQSSVYRLYAGGRSLWKSGANWAESLPGAGKRDFLRRRLAPLLLRIGVREVGAAEYEISISCPDGREHQVWLFDLLRELRSLEAPGLGLLSLDRVDSTLNRALLLQLSTRQGGRYFAKVAMHRDVGADLGREERVVTDIRRRLAGRQDLLETIPESVGSGESLGHYFRLDRRMTGSPAVEFMYQPEQRVKAINRAAEWLTRCHEATRGRDLDIAGTKAYCREILTRFESTAGKNDHSFVDRVVAYLERELRQSVCFTVLGHGDYWLGNILCDPDDFSVRGVIDWDFADPSSPPLGDLLHLLCHRKSLLTVYDPGFHIAQILSGRYSSDDQRIISAYMRDLAINTRMTGALIVLYWVRYLGSREQTLASRFRWYQRSYVRVKKVLKAASDSYLTSIGRQLVS